MPALALLTLALLQGCTRTRSRVGSESHFLAACESSEVCGDGLGCIDSLCTVSCAQDDRCGALAEGAACVAGASDGDARRCDLACDDGTDCVVLGRGFACDDGRCRALSSGGDADADGAPRADAAAPDTDAAVPVVDATTPDVDAATSGFDVIRSGPDVDAAVFGFDPGTPQPPPDAGTRPACEQPRPDPLPPLPEVNRDATGRPLFDHWRDLDCDGRLAPLCTEGPSGMFWCGICFQGWHGHDGVCTTFDIDRWCDGEGEAIGFAYGECVMCAPIEAHARACCEGLAGFDCRSWPYPGDGAPGMVCARHEDCEPDLVCAAPAQGSGYGICACPGVSPGFPPACSELLQEP